MVTREEFIEFLKSKGYKKSKDRNLWYSSISNFEFLLLESELEIHVYDSQYPLEYVYSDISINDDKLVIHNVLKG